MKRLLDETTDDFTRALLVAGIEQRPPAGNKRKVLLALGAGSALGLFSSHALAWLGTSGGKLSLLGVALGVAGAVYAVSPWSETEASGVAGVPSLAVSPATVSPPLVSPPVVPPAAVAGTASLAEPGAHASGPEGEPTGEPAVEDRPAQARGTGDRVSRGSTEPRRHKARPAASSPPVVSTPAAVAAPEEASAPEVSPLAETDARRESASLDAEVRLVDDMHWAARRNDREALARFVATYHASFPDGQLKEEVTAFAARLARPTAP